MLQDCGRFRVFVWAVGVGFGDWWVELVGLVVENGQVKADGGIGMY